MLRSSFAIQCRFIFILLTVLTSCGYRDYKTDEFSENAGELKTATFSVINRMIIQPKCASCHTHAASSEEALHDYETIREFVVPGNPNRSELFREIKTGSMPILMPALNDDEVLAIEHWIKNGALND